MRNLSPQIVAALNSNVHSKSSNSYISNRLWISRPTVPLTDSKFLECQEVSALGASDISIAVSHPSANSGCKEAYIAFSSNNIVHISKTKLKYNIYDQEWDVVSDNLHGSRVSICFDGKMKYIGDNKLEFITEGLPWLFRIDNGKLIANQLSHEDIVLSESNCTDVSCVRAMWNADKLFNYGLICFFIANGDIYYRQLVNGEWTDGEKVEYGPKKKWVELSAYRTWDYRIGLDIKSQDNKIYKIFTQFMGFAKNTTENLNVDIKNVSSKLIEITRWNTRTDEHLLVDVEMKTLYGGLYEIKAPVIVSCINIADEYDNYGSVLSIIFSNHIDMASLIGNESSMKIIDSRGMIFNSYKIIDADGTGVRLLVYFSDFNAALGMCRLIYMQGSVKNMAGTLINNADYSFVPTNLNPPEIDPPEIVSATNIDELGSDILLQFTEEIIEPVSDNSNYFIIAFDTYDKVPDGNVVNVKRKVTSIIYNEDKHYITLHMGTGNVTGIKNAISKINVQYSGGSISGIGGPVNAFSIYFEPTAMKPVFDVNYNNEHLNVAIDHVNSSLISVQFIQVSTDEHLRVDVSNVKSTLKNIHDV